MICDRYNMKCDVFLYSTIKYKHFCARTLKNILKKLQATASCFNICNISQDFATQTIRDLLAKDIRENIPSMIMMLKYYRRFVYLTQITSTTLLNFNRVYFVGLVPEKCKILRYENLN